MPSFCLSKNLRQPVYIDSLMFWIISNCASICSNHFQIRNSSTKELARFTIWTNDALRITNECIFHSLSIMFPEIYQINESFVAICRVWRDILISRRQMQTVLVTFLQNKEALTLWCSWWSAYCQRICVCSFFFLLLCGQEWDNNRSVLAHSAGIVNWSIFSLN